MKGQQAGVGGVAMVLVIAAVAIALGVVVYDAVYRNVASERIFDEYAGNFTDSVQTQTLNTLGSTPVYTSTTSLADGSAPPTGTLTVANGTTYSMTYVDGTAIVNESFNVSQGGIVMGYSTYNGSLGVTYSQVPLDANTLTSASSINTSTYGGWNLAAVGLIVLAAVAVLGYLFVLGRRA